MTMEQFEKGELIYNQIKHLAILKKRIDKDETYAMIPRCEAIETEVTNLEIQYNIQIKLRLMAIIENKFIQLNSELENI